MFHNCLIVHFTWYFIVPGASFLYTTHGWTLISAVVEQVAAKPFPDYMKSIFHELGLRNTYLDENKPIIYNRAKYFSIKIFVKWFY